MSFFNSLLGAINQGAGTYNDEADFQRMMMKDKVGLDSMRANTNLANQRFDFNELNMAQLLELAKLNNATAQQTFNYNDQMYPLKVEGQRGLNTGGEYDNQSKALGVQDKQERFDTLAVVREALKDSPELLNILNAQYALGSTSSGLASSNNSSSSPANSQFKTMEMPDGTKGYGTFNPNTGEFTQDTSNITPTGMMNTINTAIDERYPDADREFDNDANYAAFEQKASEIYQGFIAKGMDMYAAEQATKQTMLSMLSLDNDVETWFTDKELVYTPQGGQQDANKPKGKNRSYNPKTGRIE